jgi:hypothetical protein
MKVIRNLPAMAALVVALTIASQARADVIHFFLNQGECTGACGPGTVPAPIADSLAVEVTVTRTDSTHASVLFDAPGASLVGAPVWMKVAGAFQASVIPAAEGLAPTTPCGFGITACATGSEDHFGTFNVGTGAADIAMITINLVAQNGNSWANADAVLTPTTDADADYHRGFEAVVANTGPNQFAGSYVGTVVPEPALLALLGTALVGFRWFTRRRRALLA